jgi:3-hydroxyacyl-[acyl-carrier protein] dehydratase/trans-2-decenoyl-[acyl-carrier protein] isomerase
VKKLTYHVHMKRVILRRLVMGIADGIVTADQNVAFEVSDMKVGLFKDGAQAAAAAS